MLSPPLVSTALLSLALLPALSRARRASAFHAPSQELLSSGKQLRLS